MEKQENSNEKYNKTTTFLTKFLFNENFDTLKSTGFVDSYAEDPEIMKVLTLAKDQRVLFLLFKNKKLKLEELKKIVKSLAKYDIKIIFSYELINDYCMIIVNFPEEFNKDYDNVLEGHYSKLSTEFKKGFPETKDVFNDKKVRIGKQNTIYFHIFNKTEWLQDFWKKRLNLIELAEGLELWEKPNESDLVFDNKKLK